MQSRLQTLNHQLWRILSSSPCQLIIRLMLMTSLMLLWQQAFAGDDPLAGTDKSLVATLGSNGTDSKFIYMIEGVTAIATYIKT